MENQIDKLFRNKLEQHAMAPSADAWKKVAASVPKKNNTWVLTWRIAAAIAIVALGGWFILSQTKDQPVEVAEKKTQPTNEPVVTNEKAQENSAIQKEVTPAPVQRVVAKTKPLKVEQVKPVQQTKPEEETTIEQSVTEVTLASVEEVKVTELVTEQQPASKTVSAKPMVIVYTLAAVEPKQVVENEPVKPNRLKRMLEFAIDVKSGDATTYASVRNWKDNLLGSEEVTRIEKHNNE